MEGVHLQAGLVPPTRLWLLAGAARFGLLALSGSLTVGSGDPELERFWAGAIALQTGERFSLGVGLKRYRWGSAGEGTALDLGVLYRLAAFSLGVNFEGVAQGGEPLLAPLTRLGTRLDIDWLSGAAELLLSPNRRLQGRVGAELLLFFPLIFRLGWAAGGMSGGLGFDSGRLKVDLAIVAAGEGSLWMLSTEVVFHG